MNGIETVIFFMPNGTEIKFSVAAVHDATRATDIRERDGVVEVVTPDGTLRFGGIAYILVDVNEALNTLGL